MKKILTPVLLIVALATSACVPLSNQDRSNVGLVGGAGAGLLLASGFNANPAWTIAATVAGAAIGQQIGRNQATNTCLYHAGYDSAGNQVVRQAPC